MGSPLMPPNPGSLTSRIFGYTSTQSSHGIANRSKVNVNLQVSSKLTSAVSGLFHAASGRSLRSSKSSENGGFSPMPISPILQRYNSSFWRSRHEQQ